MDTLFNVNQAAFILKVHPLTIRRYIKEKRLVAVKVGGNIRIKEADLNSFHKNFEPPERKESVTIRKNIPAAKAFTEADPFLRLKGRAASVEF
ncbi:MAG: helix-turn-helix domain-containing protein [Candidatus Levyibacteriota bacterium]